MRILAIFVLAFLGTQTRALAQQDVYQQIFQSEAKLIS
jgi:hypothetical protein